MGDTNHICAHRYYKINGNICNIDVSNDSMLAEILYKYTNDCNLYSTRPHDYYKKHLTL